jgi:uncharacterized protein (DUF302 family)
MADENATSTYLIAEPFDRAVNLVRKVLSGANLKIMGELNMSGRLQRALWIRTAPCTVLFASAPTSPASFAADPQEAALTPLHIVVSAHGSQSEVHVLRVLPRDNGTLDSRTIAASSLLQTVIAQAIATIGMRASLSA